GVRSGGGGRGRGAPFGAVARAAGGGAGGPRAGVGARGGGEQDEARGRHPRCVRRRPPLLRRELRPGAHRQGILLPEDIEWHFIGNLQSNKAKALLAGVPSLDMVESVDDEKIANRLDRVVADLGRRPLKVLVQVNTSGEESKFGVDPSGCVGLAKHVKLSCPNLVFSGLMTIGMLDYSSTPENFKALTSCRKEVCDELGIPEEQCELSMGMSADFEQAIEMGSTNVRVGSTIFGAREYPKKN
uniref:Alanine racemase N-terminal domain-containing protein n=2 Tax=Aegilops tauschii subsp. strangulata TaxID=200361 RepID=A0A452Y0D1_AEGTS